MKLYEMEGFLRGKCVPGDMLVNETDAQYLVRKFTDLQDRVEVTTLALREKTKQCEQLAAENAVQREFIATCFHAAGDGGDMDGADIQALGERLGLFGRETYQPVIHGYICGHEPGEDSVYVMNKTPVTDAFLREVRAQGVDAASAELNQLAERSEKEAPIAAEHHRSAALYLQLLAAELRCGEAV